MTLRETQLVAFAAGSLIHGALALLVLKLYWTTRAHDRAVAVQRVAVCFAGFFWQFGNLWETSGLFHPLIGSLMLYSALVTFPLWFGYSLPEPVSDSRLATFLLKVGRGFRYPQWVLTPLFIVSAFQAVLGFRPLVDPDAAIQISLRMLVLYVALFVVIQVIRSRRKGPEDHPTRVIRRMILMLMPICAVVIAIVLTDITPGEKARWLESFARMMSIPSTIATAYRLYRFPFMDVFLRETLIGIGLLTTFCIGISIGPQGDWRPLWISAVAMGIALTRAPLARAVERKFLGWKESAEQLEERVDAAIRDKVDLGTFDADVSEILRKEVDADWTQLAAEPMPGAVTTFTIPDSPPLTLSLGPRRNARPYMTRQLRLLRTSAFQIAAQRQRLKREDSERRSLIERHELKEITSRAQMKALQAQINPHFLFNTLNTLAALIDSNPEKAEKVTENLADVFRYALDSTRVERVKLDEELKFLDAYLAIEKTRFDTRLSYSFDVDPAALKLSIPPMILQPLVENAVRHGIGQKIEGGSVCVRARVNAETLMLCVEDTGAGFGGERPGGVGLSNTRDRLKHAYGDTSEFRIEAAVPEGTRMVIVLKQPS